MDIQKYIDSYVEWLKSEISFTKVGEYYEINTPFLNNDNDYLQFYVKQDGNEIYFTDDGFTINTLEMTGFSLTPNRKKQLQQILIQYGVQLKGKELTIKAPANQFAQKKHAFIQCLLRVSVQFTGKSGFYHNYDFAIQRSKEKPERLCLAINNPSKAAMGNALFAWEDTKPSRRQDSKLIVILNDANGISKGIEDGFESYDVDSIRWSQRSEKIELLTA